MTTKEFEKQTLEQLLIDLKDIDNYKSFRKGAFVYDLGHYQGQLLLQEINRLNNIINKLEKWLNEYYENNRKWYNTELSNHDRKYYEREYRNTEFMIVKFKKQLNELKGDNK